MEKAYKELARDIKELTSKVNDKTKQSEKELNETKQVLETCRKEYRKLYNGNIELKIISEILKLQKQQKQMYLQQQHQKPEIKKHENMKIKLSDIDFNLEIINSKSKKQKRRRKHEEYSLEDSNEDSSAVEMILYHKKKKKKGYYRLYK